MSDIIPVRREPATKDSSYATDSEKAERGSCGSGRSEIGVHSGFSRSDKLNEGLSSISTATEFSILQRLRFDTLIDDNVVPGTIPPLPTIRCLVISMRSALCKPWRFLKLRLEAKPQVLRPFKQNSGMHKADNSFI